MKFKIDLLSKKDIPALLELTRGIGWDYNRSNWLQFLKLGKVIGHRTTGDLPGSKVFFGRDD